MFKVGDFVRHESDSPAKFAHKIGRVIRINDFFVNVLNQVYPIRVAFTNGLEESYTQDGRQYKDSPPVLRLIATNPQLVLNTSPPQAVKHDDAKADFSQLAPIGMFEEAKAMTHGAKEYGGYNWRLGGFTTTRLLAAALRHIFKFLNGEDIDRDSGLFHLSLAKAELGMAIQIFYEGGKDGRFKKDQEKSEGNGNAKYSYEMPEHIPKPD